MTAVSVRLCRWRSVAAAALTVVITASSYGQAVDAATKLRVAQALEQAGEWERAIPLFEDLNRQEPTNYIYFDGLRRGYAQLKEYDKAIDLTRRMLEPRGNDANLLSILASLYFESGHESVADSLWGSVLRLDPKNSTLYRTVAAQMMEHRLYDQAIGVYQQGRIALRDDAIFAEELGALLSALQRYGAATNEYLRLLWTSPQMLSFIQSRIASFTIQAEGLRESSAAVHEALRTRDSDPTLHSLLAWLLMEGKDYDGAYKEYETIEQLRPSKGMEMLGFAQRALQERALAAAGRAFKYVIDRSANAPLIPQAKLGYARSVEEQTSAVDTALSTLTGIKTIVPPPASQVNEAGRSPQPAIPLYEEVARVYPNSEYAAQAYLRMSLIRFEGSFDLTGALDDAQKARQLSGNSSVGCEATLKAGEIYCARNDLGSARKEYRALLGVTIALYQQQALFRIAELDYFEGRFDSTISELKLLALNPGSDLTNDALQLQYFIQENQGSASAGLVDFARADLLMRQGKYAESLARFQAVAREYSASLLLDDAMMKIGQMQLLLHRTDLGMAAFRSVADSLPLSILKDRALMNIAKVYHHLLNDRQHALELYEQLLTRFPNSLYAEEARRQIRLLRGDSI